MSARGGYDARLIGWLELVGTQSWNQATLARALEEMQEANATEFASNEADIAGDQKVPLTLEPLGISENVDQARALSIRQPHAEAIMRGIKETEYRSVPTKIRGRILIYAGQGRYSAEEEAEMMEAYDMTTFHVTNFHGA